jgi:hypothetical protein
VDTFLQIVAAVGGTAGLAALIKGVVEWRASKSANAKTDAEADKVEIDGAQAITAVALQLLEPLRTQVAALTVDLKAARAEVVASRAEVAALTSSLNESRAEVDLLTRYIEELVAVLRAAQLPIPPKPTPFPRDPS